MTRKEMQKKIMCILLSLAMVLTLIPATALAEDSHQQENKERWAMLFSDSAIDLSDTENVDLNNLRNHIRIPGVQGTKNVYLYLAREGTDGYDYSSLEVLTTETFDIQYLRGNPDHIPATGVTIKKASDGKGAVNYYQITTDNSKQQDYSTGQGLYDVWPTNVWNNETGANRVIYNSMIDTSEQQGGGNNQVYRRPIFSQVPLLTAAGQPDGPLESAPVSSVLQMTVPEEENQVVSITRYAYIGTYENGDLTRIEPVTGNIKLRYLMEASSSGPVFAAENEWIDAVKVSDAGEVYNCQYRFDINSSSYDNYQRGTGEYDIWPADADQNNLANASLRITTEQNADVDQKAVYDITLEMLQDPADYVENGYNGDTSCMWVNGQGSALPFNSKITEWDTCFYVNNRNTGYDARFEPAPGKPEVRTYIGNDGDFVIEARSKSGGNWMRQDRLSSEYQIFALSYVGDYKGFYNMFNVKYTTADIGQVRAAADKYFYRLRYTGNDPYMRNGQNENCFIITLEYDDNLAEFDIDEYFIDETGRWATGNYHHFNIVGTELKMKKIIRPGVLKSVEDKKIYDKNDYIFIENELENMKFYRMGDSGFIEMTPEESPFSMVWDAANRYYVLTYDKPDKDIYGPEYYMSYGGDYNGKINAHYNTAGEHRVGNLCGLVTGKLTVRAGADDVKDGTIDASTDNKDINTTEVIFGMDVLKQLNRELKFKTKHGEIDFTGDVVDNLKKSTQNVDASFEMQDVKTDSHGMTNEQKNALGHCDVAFDFDIASGEAKVEFGENGSAAIVIPFTDTSKAVYYLDENGKVHPVEYVFEQGHVKFIAKHFSTYVVAEKGLEDGEVLGNPGTSGGTGGSAAPSDQITQSGAATTVDLSGSTVSKGGETTTTVAQTTADKLVETAVKNNSEEIIVDAVTKNPSAADSAKSAEVILSGGTLKDIAEKTEADVVIRTNVAEVRMDAATVKAAASQAAPGETVSIVTEKVKEAAKEIRFELKIVTGSGKVISDFQGGNVAVTVSVPKSLRGKKLTCVYIDENGYMHRVEGTLNADGTYTFTTGHFSQYALMDEEDAKSAIQAQKAEVEAVKLTLRTRLVKMKSGKKAIKLTWKGGEDIHLDGIEIYRSTKRSAGYVKKPLFTTTKTAYYNTAARAGKRYYYKVRGFVTIDGKKVYTQYSTKAWRTVK